MDQKTEIRSYIKCRIRLNIDSKQIFNDSCGIYGPQTISMCTVFRWVKAFKAGKFSVEDDTNPGRPKTSVTKANIAAVKIVVEQDARLSVKDIASCTGISDGSVQTILKKYLDLSICLEVLLAALFISVSNRYQKKTTGNYLLFATE